jgi:uncharacterized membrane protein YtjA (UPF0391 family)
MLLIVTGFLLALALIAAIFGFSDLAKGSAGLAKILFFIFLVLCLISLFF